MIRVSILKKILFIFRHEIYYLLSWLNLIVTEFLAALLALSPLLAFDIAVQFKL